MTPGAARPPASAACAARNSQLFPRLPAALTRTDIPLTGQRAPRAYTDCFQALLRVQSATPTSPPTIVGSRYRSSPCPPHSLVFCFTASSTRVCCLLHRHRAELTASASCPRRLPFSPSPRHTHRLVTAFTRIVCNVTYPRSAQVK